MEKPKNRVTKRLLTRLIAGALLLGTHGGALALGLGKFTLQSRLNEPLRAEIELTAATPNELKTLRSGLAPYADFERAGVDYAPHLFAIKFELLTPQDGPAVLRLSTDQPIREPFLHLLVQADWSGGHLIREYTALLDPPGYLQNAQPELAAPRIDSSPAPLLEETPAAAAAEAPVAVGPDTAGALPAPNELPIETTPEAAVDIADAEPALFGPPLAEDVANAELEAATTEATTEPAPAQAGPVEYGPVKRGETLFGIVKGLGFDPKVNADQAMLAILKANTDAFRSGNINNLRRGVILKVPDEATIAQLAPERARREVRAQYTAWQEYKLKLAAARTATSRAEQPNVARGNVKPADQAKADARVAPDTKPGTVAAGEQDLLKIVRAHLDDDNKAAKDGEKQAPGGESVTGRAGGNQVLRDKVSSLEEALESKELENRELRERLTMLEAQVKNAQRLMEIENKAGALAQNQAAQPATPAAQPAPTPPPAVVPAPAAAPKPAQPAPPKPAVAKAPPAPAPEPEVGLLDDLMNNPLLYPAAGGLAAIVLGGLALYVRRRRRSLAEFEESILAGGGVNTENQTGGAANAGDVSILSNFSLAGMGNMHTDEVDPIAEAEVYLAYGRDEQAEEILKDAIAKTPTRHELRVKLMEIYQQRKDLSAFETVAEELYAALEGKGGKLWEKVEEMGRKMNPQNPMFAGAGVKAAPVASAVAPAFASAADTEMEDSVFDLDLSAENPAGESRAEPAGVSRNTSLDFAPSGRPVEEVAFGLDLDSTVTGLGEDAGDDALSASKPGPSATDEKLSVEFDLGDLNLDAGAPSVEQNQTETAELEAAEVGEIEWNFDVSVEGGPVDAGGIEVSSDGDELGDDGAELLDEASTKLDLAKAYIDMGDPDGARGILDEVLAEGNESQKKQAQDLYAQLR